MSVVHKLISKAASSNAALPVKKSMRRLMETYYNAAVVNRLSTKTEPLRLVVENDQPVRINIVIPEINFECFYGGYIAKFNLGLMLAQRGRKVRLLTVDPCPYQLDHWRERIKDYTGLEDVFDFVEVQCCDDRKKGVPVNPEDTFIATTWWTAYIAHAAAQQLGQEKFIYLIQEYEPFTFSMGSYYAMARSSYDFPHNAIFSTQLLQAYFETQYIGVYAEQDTNADHNAMAFENAIFAYAANELTFQNRTPHRLLFYARPEAHASRNMFEIAYIALCKAIEQDVFSDQWEFHGIGSNHKNIPLPNERELVMRGIVGLSEYRELLPQYDIGLSLMYTPHPSLLPLEMAAAGMVVVTSECMNKTHSDLHAISSNLYGAVPTIDGVLAALKRAVEKANDKDSRLRGSEVHWASSWSQAFSDDIFQRLDNWIGHKQ